MPNGRFLEFEGDVEACLRFAEGYSGSAKAVRAASSIRRYDAKRTAQSVEPRIRVGEMRAALAHASPKTDTERVAVIAAVAQQSGRRGLDKAFFEEWFEILGLRQPAAMRSTLSNAKKAGLLRSPVHGRYEATPLAAAFLAGSSENVVPLRRRAQQ